MTLFIVRVELHNASAADYAKLAKDLAGKGIVDVIKADNGRFYKLPLAEYCHTTAQSLQQVLETVKTCAARVSARYKAVVTASAGCIWEGLEEVPQTVLAQGARW